MPLIFICSLLWSNFIHGELNFTPIITAFVFFYSITLAKAIFLFGYLSLYTLFLSTNIFFTYGKLIVHLAGKESFLRFTWPVIFTVKEKTGIIFICIAFLSHYIMDIIFVKHYKPAKNTLMHYPKMGKLGLAMMLCTFPVILLKLMLIYRFVRENGYLSIYNGKLSELIFPIWMRGSGTLFILGYFFVLFSYPNKNVYLISSSLFLIYSLADSLKGGRTAILTATIITLYMYSKLYTLKIKLKSIVIIVLFFLIFSSALGQLRTISKIEKVSAKDLVLFALSGGSSSVVMLGIEYQDDLKYRHYPYIFSALVYPIQRYLHPSSGQDDVSLKYYNFLGSELMHKLSPSLYYSGTGFGESLLSQMYDAGKFPGIIFWSLLSAFLFLLTDRFIVLKNLYIPLCWIIAKSVPMLPRNPLFAFAGNIYFVIIFFIFLLLLNFVFFPKKINIGKAC
jgi:hypothetical protein